jgi:ABC-type nitrate/sulfonate/bicarbonate transport system substrate-binding protein
MNHLKGRRIVLMKSLNTIKNHWWRITEHMGIDTILRLNDMTLDDVDIVVFAYADVGYDNPKMLEPLNNPTELYSGLLNHKKNLACVEIAKAFMVQHGYIKRDFDVQRWAAPEFLERAAKEPIDGTWQKKTDAMLPTGTTIHLG